MVVQSKLILVYVVHVSDKIQTETENESFGSQKCGRKKKFQITPREREKEIEGVHECMLGAERVCHLYYFVCARKGEKKGHSEKTENYQYDFFSKVTWSWFLGNEL